MQSSYSLSISESLLPGDRPPPVLAEELGEGLSEQGLDRPALGGAEHAQLAVDGWGKVAGNLDATGTAVPGGGALCLGRLGCGRGRTALRNRADWKPEVHMRQTPNPYSLNGGARRAGARLPSPATLPLAGAKLPVAAGRHALPSATLFLPRQRPLVGTVSKSILFTTVSQFRRSIHAGCRRAYLGHLLAAVAEIHEAMGTGRCERIFRAASNA